MTQAHQPLSGKLSAASLRVAIRQGEGAAVEFKSNFQQEVIETLTAFANTQGESVLMGVSDAGQIVGVNVQAEIVQGWINQCRQITSLGEYPIKPEARKGRYSNNGAISVCKPKLLKTAKIQAHRALIFQ